MLPGLRFLFAATLMSVSLLVFGMGAIALMRASHQQFVSLSPRPPSEPVFAQAPQTVPSLSMLRAEPSPPAPPPTEPAPDRSASLTNAERAIEPAPPQPFIAEPKPSEPSGDARSDAATPTPADPPPMPAVTPLAERPAEAPAVAVAEAPALPEPAPTLAAPETVPASTAPRMAEAPTSPSPEITGSVPPQDEQPGSTASVISEKPPVGEKPVLDPPLPQARPEVAALPPETRIAPARAAPKVVVKRKVRQAMKRRARAKREKLPATSSAPTLGSLFGVSSSSN